MWPWIACRPRRVLVPVLALAAGLVIPGRSAAQGIAASEGSLVFLARAYTAAWNAHDLEAALACFAPDAVITCGEAGLRVAVWEAAREATTHGDGGHGEDTEGVYAIPGTAAIQAHLRAQVVWQGHVEAWDYRAAGSGVTWSYRRSEAAEPHVPGIRPVEGTAEASVRAGRIMRLRLAHDPGSVAARATAVAATAPRRATNPDASSTGSPASGPTGDGHPPESAAEAGAAASDGSWPLGLAGRGASAALLAGRRRHRTRRG